MATMTGSVSSSGSGWKTGWDFFWREQREEVQKNLPKGLSFEEAKKELKRRLKEAWNGLSGSEKKVYERKVVSNAGLGADATARPATEVKIHAKASSSAGSGASCHAFFLGKSAKKSSVPAKENSPVENTVPKFDLDGSSTGTASQKRRATSGQKSKEPIPKPSMPRKFTSIRDTGNSSGGSGSGGSDSVKSNGDMGNVDRKKAKAGGVSAAPAPHSFFMTKEQKDAFKAKKRKEQEEEEERRRLKEIQENERRQQERMEEIKARRKQDATVFAAKGSGVNEFFVESEKRIAKEKALVAGHGDTGDNADDDRVETWANFPEVQNVGLTRSLESFPRSSNHSSSDASATFMIEKRRTENNVMREAGLSLSNSRSMVVDLVAQEENEQRSLLKDRLVERMQASKGGPNINAYGEALSEFGMSDSVLRSLVGTLLESSVFGIDRVPSQAQERREAVVEAAKLRKQAHTREAQVVDLAADDDDDDCGNGGDGGGGGGGDAWDNKLVGCEGLTRSSGCVMDVLSGADKALVDMFEPRGKEDILGNDETKDELEQWLLGWAGKRAESKKEKKPRGKKRRRSNYCDSDSEEEDDANANALDNVAAVWGPSGAGKTALVYALADRTGFNVIEIGASQLRSGSEINKRFQEAAKSQGLKLDASAASTPFSIAASAAKSPCKQKLNLILFDEADLEFEEDASMYKAMQSLIKTTRTPIIITAERHDRTNSPLSFLRIINAMDCPMQRPSPWQLGTLVMSILTNSLGLGSHNVPAANLAATLAQIHSGDVRGCLHSLQLLIPSLLCDKTVLKSLKEDAKAGGESKLSLSLDAWLASSGALPVMIDRLVPTLKAALVQNASLVSQSTSTDSALDPGSAAASHSQMQPLCAPLISDVSPRVGPRRGGHVVRVEGRHFLQRLQMTERGNVDVEDGDEAGAAPILPLVVCVGGTQLGAEHVAILSDVVLEIRVPALQAGLHVVSVALKVPTRHGITMLTSDVCGVSRAWIRVRPPPGKGDIRTFFTESNRVNGGSGSRGLQLISDARVSTAMDRSRSRSGYVDDSDEEELEEERRRRLKLERESRGRSGKRGGGLKLVKGGARNKKARTSEEGQGHAAVEMGHDKDRDKEAEVEEDIIDSDEDADCGEGGVKAVDGAAALRKKRRVLPDSSDDEELGAVAVAMGHEGKKEEEDTEGQMTVEVQSSSFPSDAVRQLAATLSPEELKACMGASLDSVWDAGVTVPFLKPVDDNRLPDFARVVERPLDLGTIRDTMDHYAVNGVFIPESLWDFVADVRLVWSNCILYDDPKFAPVEHAKLLSTAFDAAMRREVQEALRAVVDRDDNTAQSPLSQLSAEQVSSLKDDVAAAAASLIPAGPVYSEVDEGDLADFGLCPVPLSQAAPADLRKHLLVAETARKALRERTKAYSGPPAGQECDDVESNPVDLLPPPGVDCGRAERHGDCAGLEFLSSLLDCWSDAELLDAHSSLAPSMSDVQGQLLHARSGAYTTSLLSSEAPSTLLGHHLERLLLPGTKGHDSERVVGAFLRAMHRCEDSSVLPPDRDASSPLVRYLLDARSEDPAQAEGQNSPSGRSDGGEEVAMALADEEEEEFDEGMFSAAAPSRAGGGRRGEGPSPDAVNAHGAPSGWASVGTCFQPSSLRLSLQQREYSDFVSEILVPEYRFSGSKGPQRRVFDNLCLETRVSREIALDSFPYISKMLRAEASAPQTLSERSSRRSAAAGNLQRFPYFYSKSNDMELHDMETILKLGSIPL